MKILLSNTVNNLNVDEAIVINNLSELVEAIKKHPQHKTMILEELLTKDENFKEIIPNEIVLSKFINEFPDVIELISNNEFKRILKGVTFLINLTNDCPLHRNKIVSTIFKDTNLANHFLKSAEDLLFFVKKIPEFAQTTIQLVLNNKDIFDAVFKSHIDFTDMAKSFPGCKKAFLTKIISNDVNFNEEKFLGIIGDTRQLKIVLELCPAMGGEILNCIFNSPYIFRSIVKNRIRCEATTKLFPEHAKWIQCFYKIFEGVTTENANTLREAHKLIVSTGNTSSLWLYKYLLEMAKAANDGSIEFPVLEEHEDANDYYFFDSDSDEESSQDENTVNESDVNNGKAEVSEQVDSESDVEHSQDNSAVNESDVNNGESEDVKLEPHEACLNAIIEHAKLLVSKLDKNSLQMKCVTYIVNNPNFTFFSKSNTSYYNLSKLSEDCQDLIRLFKND